MPYYAETKILCINENNEEVYVPIKDIRVGDYVKTYAHGNKKVTMLVWSNFRGPSQNIQQRYKYSTQISSIYCYLKSSDNNLTDSLVVTGSTNLLVDTIDNLNENQKKLNDYCNPVIKMIDDKILVSCNSKSEFLIMDYTPERREFYQLVLENEDENGSYGIWANNVLVQSCSFKNRMKDRAVFLLEKVIKE